MLQMKRLLKINFGEKITVFGALLAKGWKAEDLQ